MDIIQKKLTEFSGKTFSDHKSFSIELEKAFKAIQEETIDDVIKLSDKIESKIGTPDIKEWKAFKHLRNTLRDNLDKLCQ